MDEKIPGFASWTDKAADVWVNVTDYFNPKPGDSKKEEEEEKFVYEYNKAKSKARLEELKKGQPASGDIKDFPTSAKGATLLDQKAKKDAKGDLDKSGSSETTTNDKPKSKPKSLDKAKSKEVVAEAKPVAAKDKSKSIAEKQSKSKEVKSKDKKSEVVPSKQETVEKKSKEVKAQKSKSETAAEKSEVDTGKGRVLKELEPEQVTKPGSVTSEPLSPSSSPPSSLTPSPQAASAPAPPVTAPLDVAGQETGREKGGVATTVSGLFTHWQSWKYAFSPAGIHTTWRVIFVG